MIHHVTIVGAGTMGSQIAAHLANVGLTCDLLDAIPGAAGEAVERMRVSKRSPFTIGENAGRIRPGNVDDHLDRVAEADWVIEAITEDLAAKQELHTRIDEHRREGSFVTTNTSGLSVSDIAGGRSDDFTRHFFGAHFFNPPRHMHLLEIIPSTETDPGVLVAFESFASDTLGKGVVRCKDTPNFIGNRIGIFAITSAIHLAIREELSLAEADALTGIAIGRPRTGTFRLADLIGLDVLMHAARTTQDAEAESPWADLAQLPDCVQQLVDDGRLGDKTGSGFYRRNEDGQILSLNLSTLEYESSAAAVEGVDAVRRIPDPSARWNALTSKVDEHHLRFARRCLLTPLHYAAGRAADIANDIASVDRAMRWGYNWEIGPFEWWDALGVGEAADQLIAEGWEMPGIVESLLQSESTSFHTDGKAVPLLEDGETSAVDDDREVRLAVLKNSGRTLEQNDDASIIDLGNGIACLEFHSKMNIINRGTLDLMEDAPERLGSGFSGLVIGNNADHFSVGMNLVEMNSEADAGDWDAIDVKLNRLQQACLGLLRAPFPVVSAPAGLTLGGGCEIAFGADRMLAASETSIGLVEVKVGLIPAGGGTTEMAARALKDMDATDSEVASRLKTVFDILFAGTMSASAAQGRALGFLKSEDQTTFHPRHRLHQATELVRQMSKHYSPPGSRRILALGQQGLDIIDAHIESRRSDDELTEHDVTVAGELALVLCGGDGSSPKIVDEQAFLDLEREAFLRLCGFQKTRDRIGHMLKTGKPLRN